MNREPVIAEGSIPPYSNDPVSPFSEAAEEDAENIFKFLFFDATVTPKSFSNRFWKSLLIRKDAIIGAQLQKSWQKVSIYLYRLLEAGIERDVEKIIEIQIGDMLAVLPFLEPDEGSCFFVPQKIDGRWNLIQQRVERIELTPSFLGAPMVAFGMVSQSGFPLLLFMGTPHPTATGSFLSVWTDFIPGYSVGEAVYKWFAKEKIAKWIESAVGSTGRRVHIYGQSLGGALALLTVCDFYSFIDEVHAYAAPGVSKSVSAKFNAQQERLAPLVNVYVREGDPVFLLGAFKAAGWQLFRIGALKKENPFFAHLKVCPGFSGIKILKIAEATENGRLSRKLCTFGHFLLSLLLFPFFTAILLFKMLVRLFTKRGF